MKIIKQLLSCLGVAAFAATASADMTLPQCIDAARENYPLIKKYELLEATQDIELSDIDKGWLPRLGLYAQGTLQNVVPAYPESLRGVMQQMGNDVKGLSKLQYKVGLDVTQTIWDGGASKAQRELTRRSAETQRASVEVDMYAIRERVQSLYFGILLIESQIEQTEAAEKVYDANLARLRSMVANGVAMASDADMVEAQLLGLRQQLVQARSAAKGYRDVLSIFTGRDLASEKLLLPSAEMPLSMTPERPELALLDARKALNDARRALTDVSLMPKIGFFAQTYYGYPGFDYFKAMMGREPSFNIIGGVKVSWDIDSFYTRKNSLRKVDIADLEAETDRETFLFNTKMLTASQTEEIEGLRGVMAEDARILELRRAVRLAAESQLKNGVIDATALTVKINDETQAALASSYHSIQYLQTIHKLRNTLNR